MDGKALIMIVLASLVLYFFMTRKSTYVMNKTQGIFFESNDYADFDGSVGVSSSLLPKEIPSQEDFGKFSPEAIMQGQNYLDPRSQIGYPETVGGVLRNANYDVRSEPQNPRFPISIFNNSTIVPDSMRPQFEIGR